MNIHGIELDERYAPHADVIDWFLGLPSKDKVRKVGELSLMASTDRLNDEQGFPREFGNSLEREQVLMQFIRSKRVN